MRRALTRGALQVQTPRTTRCFSSLQPAPLPSLDGGVFDVVVFPGQGAQRPGMAKDLADNFKEARLVLEEVDEALKFNLSKLMFSGTEAELSQTQHTQPALLAHCMAAYRALASEIGLPPLRLSAGHSVGEYSALASQGALSLPDAARLLRARGQTMQAAADAASQGGRVALAMDACVLAPLGAGVSFTDALLPAVQRACEAASATLGGGQVACIAGINSPQQLVLSGHAAAVDAAVTALRSPQVLPGEESKPPAALVRRAVRLPVSAPFHSTIMAPAAEAMSSLLLGSPEHAPVPLAAPAVPLVSNVSAAPETDPAALRKLLLAGITAPVGWYQDVAAIASAAAACGAGSVRVWELGPGSTLTGLVKQGWATAAPRGLELALVNVATAKDVAAAPKV